MLKLGGSFDLLELFGPLSPFKIINSIENLYVEEIKNEVPRQLSSIFFIDIGLNSIGKKIKNWVSSIMGLEIILKTMKQKIL